MRRSTLLGLLRALRLDLRFALRMLVRRPGFSAAIVLTTALGIGANTALFSVVRAVLLRPLAYADPQKSLMPVKSRPLSPYLKIFGRLKPLVNMQQANAELTVLNRQYATAHPAMLDAKPNTADDRARVLPLQESVVANIRFPLLLLTGAVGLLLLIVCANVASLLLARAATRSREFAVRAALGAGHGRLVRQLLTESTLLSLMGGSVGILLACLGLRGIRTLTALDLPRSSEIRLEPGVLCFALALSALTGILFGLAPALSAFRRDLAAVLQGHGGQAPGRLRRRLPIGPRGLLVAGQMALSLILLVGAALLLQSLANLYRVDPGFHTDNVLTMSVAPSPAIYDTDEKRANFYQLMVDRVTSLPGVDHAAVTLTLPTTGWAGSPVQLTSHPPSALNQRPIAIVQQISPDYFRTLQIPLKQGRAFTSGDSINAPPVAIVDESLARRLWPDDPAVHRHLGEQLLLGRSQQPLEIVGIAADIHQEGRDATPRPGIYVPSAQRPAEAAILILRTKSDPASFADSVRRRILTIDRNQPVSDITTLSAVLDASEVQRRLMLTLLGSFAIAATLLAVLGLYSVISYSVVERTREIAIRQALGAPRSNVLRLVLRQGLGLAFIGIVTGIVGALSLTHLLNSMLFGVKALDPVTFLLASSLFLFVALAASYLPARRAAAIEPMVALRDS